MEAERRHKKDGLRIHLINVDKLGGETAARTALEKTTGRQAQLGIEFPLFIHTGPFEPLAKVLGSSSDAPPITAIFKDGKLLRTVNGAFEQDGLEKSLADLKVFGP